MTNARTHTRTHIHARRHARTHARTHTHTILSYLGTRKRCMIAVVMLDLRLCTTLG